MGKTLSGNDAFLSGNDAFVGGTPSGNNGAEIRRLAEHTARTMVLLANRKRTSGYTLIANNVYPDGLEIEIERGR